MELAERLQELRDGTLCNKIGTRMLAEAAAEREVPTIVACEVIKLAPPRICNNCIEIRVEWF